MEEVITAFDSKQRKNLLTASEKFVVENLQRNSFVDRFGVETKRNFIQSIVSFLKNEGDSLNSKEKTNLLQSLRLCSRENVAIENLHENFEEFVRLSGLMEKNPVEREDNTEALRLVVNLVASSPENREKLLKMDGFSNAFYLVENSSFSSPRLFPLLRILFHFTVNLSNREKVKELRLFDYFVNLLEIYLKTEDGDPVNGLEILKLLFNVTAHLGPLCGPRQEATQEELKLSRRLFTQLKRVLLNREEKNEQMKQAMLSCVINIPIKLIPEFVDQKVVDEFLYVLEVHAKKENIPPLVSVLMILTGIVTSSKEWQKYVKKFLYAKQENAEVTMSGPSDLSYLASKLREFVGSTDVALKHTTQEFLFSACGSNAEELARMNGIGPTAGILSEKNMLSVLSSLKPPPAPQVPLTKEEQEQREKDLEEIADKMERLEKLGIFKRKEG